MRLSRADRSRVADWWFTVDHVLVGAILALVAAGLVLSLAASPAVAIRKGLPTYYFVERHLFFSAVGVLIMLAVSLFSPRGVRRLALTLFAVSMLGLVAVFFIGPEIHGAQRWLTIGGHSIQPSEFAKPGFVVLSAWLFAESQRRADMPALPLAILVAACFTGLLISQPDVGQTLLVSAVWGHALLPLGAGAARRRHHRRVRSHGACLRLFLVRPRALAHRQILRADAGRLLAARPRHKVVLGRRVPRPRPRRRHDQDGAPRRPH
jgi:cell division protein FtsW